MWSMVAGFQNAAPFVTERYHALASRHPSVAPTYHARIVRAVQVCTHEYMQMVAHNIADGVIGVEVPNFTVMLQELKRGTFHNSTNWVDIPEAYLDPVPPQRSMTGSSAGGGSGSTTITYASTRTGVSSLSTPSGETPTVTRTSVTRVENPAGDAEFANIPLRAGGTRNILREHRPPSNDAGQEFCVAWWTKGGCFPNCGRRATHTPFASAGERSRLLAYVRDGATRKRRADQISEAEAALGKLAVVTEKLFATHGWVRTVALARGKSDITPTVGQLSHRAARLLTHLKKRGATVPVHTPAWPIERRDGAVTRGAHRSSAGERQFVCEEMLDFCAQGYWIVMPYRAVRQLRHLRVSPLGVVPQRDRRPRLIVDYTFSKLNEETLQLAPREAMQFGRALQRVCSTLVHADPRHGPVYMAKIDIADGFYRVWVRIEDIPKLGVVLPCIPGHEPIIAFPLALPMGWVESPPYFTILTETACDVANQMLRTGDRCLWDSHRLEAVAATPPAGFHVTVPPANTSRATAGGTSRPSKPVAAVDVYVDDFLLLAQTKHQQRRVLRAALHSIDRVFSSVGRGRPAPSQRACIGQEILERRRLLDDTKAHPGVGHRLPNHDLESATASPRTSTHCPRLAPATTQTPSRCQVAPATRRATVHVSGPPGHTRALLRAPGGP
ncbi:hypothetical protein MHU86_5340 [Fragilaria crotonensis]|nr:hypothetical protein MHU86_5340 [Fragilaria crotonensis]